jgi:hypothetical protein
MEDPQGKAEQVISNKAVCAAVAAVAGIALLTGCGASEDDVFSYCDKYGNLVYLFDGSSKGEALAVVPDEEGCQK